MQEYELIEAVKKHPVLYDTKHVNYLRTTLKRRIWNDIAKALKYKEGHEAKSIWLKLRGSYRDARRRYNRNLKEGMIAADFKPWRLMSQMSFLEPFMTTGPQEKIRNKEIELNDDLEYPAVKSKNNSEKNYDMGGEVNTAKIAVNEEIIGENQISLDAPEKANNICSDIEIPSISKTKTSICVKKNIKLNDILSLLNISIQAKETRTRERENEKTKLWEEKETMNDSLYTFFMSMYQSTKAMPPQQQHIVKSQIFQAVSNAEANILNLSIEQQPEAFSNSQISDSFGDLPPLLLLHPIHQIKEEESSETFTSEIQNITHS